jgi:hypothetical protein
MSRADIRIDRYTLNEKLLFVLNQQPVKTLTQMTFISQRPGRSLLPIVLLSAAGFTVMTTEFIIVGLLPSMAADLGVSGSQAGLLVTLFALTVAVAGPFLTLA